MKKTGKLLATAVLFCLWFCFQFLMHLACFDVFSENLWYFYVIALGFFLLQLAVIWLLQRLQCYWPLLVYASLYGIVILLWDGYLLIGKLFSRFFKYPVGLDVLSLACDLLGLIICCICFKEQTKKAQINTERNTGDG